MQIPLSFSEFGGVCVFSQTEGQSVNLDKFTPSDFALSFEFSLSVFPEPNPDINRNQTSRD
jgi:hypothetical protein